MRDEFDLAELVREHWRQVYLYRKANGLPMKTGIPCPHRAKKLRGGEHKTMVSLRLRNSYRDRLAKLAQDVGISQTVVVEVLLDMFDEENIKNADINTYM